MRVHHEDARPYLRRTDARYDAIMVDVYRQPYIPFYLATREFFELARDRLRPGGVRDRERGPSGGPEELEKVLSGHDGGGVPTRCCATRVEDTNTQVLGTQRAGSRRGCCAQPRVPPELRHDRAGRGRPACAARSQGGAVYTDDRAPVEWLIDKSIVEYAANGD